MPTTIEMPALRFGPVPSSATTGDAWRGATAVVELGVHRWFGANGSRLSRQTGVPPGWSNYWVGLLSVSTSSQRVDQLVVVIIGPPACLEPDCFEHRQCPLKALPVARF